MFTLNVLFWSRRGIRFAVFALEILEDSKKLKSIELIKITLFGSKTRHLGAAESHTTGYSGQEEKNRGC